MRGNISSNRVIRGGNFNNSAVDMRSSIRNNDSPSNANNNIGFRCCASELTETPDDRLQGRGRSASGPVTMAFIPRRHSLCRTKRADGVPELRLGHAIPASHAGSPSRTPAGLEWR